MDVIEWTHERRLRFIRSEKWSGWFCARCCWNVALPSRDSDPAPLAPSVEKEFRYHDCYAFAEKYWSSRA